MIDADTISAVAADLRDVPRGCIGDWPEMLVWLRRQARRLERATGEPTSQETGRVAPRLAGPRKRRGTIKVHTGRQVVVESRRR